MNNDFIKNALLEANNTRAMIKNAATIPTSFPNIFRRVGTEAAQQIGVGTGFMGLLNTTQAQYDERGIPLTWAQKAKKYFSDPMSYASGGLYGLGFVGAQKFMGKAVQAAGNKGHGRLEAILGLGVSDYKNLNRARFKQTNAEYAQHLANNPNATPIANPGVLSTMFSGGEQKMRAQMPPLWNSMFDKNKQILDDLRTGAQSQLANDIKAGKTTIPWLSKGYANKTVGDAAVNEKIKEWGGSGYLSGVKNALTDPFGTSNFPVLPWMLPVATGFSLPTAAPIMAYNEYVGNPENLRKAYNNVSPTYKPAYV